MPEGKERGILYSHLEKLIEFHLVWNTIRRLQKGNLFFMTRLVLVQLPSDSLPKYGSTTIRFFLDTVLQQFLALILCPKIVLCIYQRSQVGNYFYARHFLTY